VHKPVKSFHFYAGKEITLYLSRLISALRRSAQYTILCPTILAAVQDKIKPQLKTFDLTMIVAGLVIGMGIFRVPSEVAQKAGVPLIFFLAWITGAIVSLFGALTFAEIGSRYPVAGGFYKIFSHCYHPCFAFMVNWIIVISNAAGTAGVAIMGAEYIAPVLFPFVSHDIAVPAITVSSTITLYVINMVGIRVSAKLLNGLMFVKLGLLLLLITAVFFVRSPHAQEVAVMPHQSAGSMLMAFAMCFIPIFFTYGGYQHTMNFGNDVHHASRTMPRAIFYGISIVLFIYLSVNYAYYKILGFSGLAHSPTVASDISGLIFGPVAFKLVSVIMFLSVMAYVNVSIMANPRVYFAMAEDKILPPIFKRLNHKTQVQEFALTVFCGFILVTLFFISSFQKILEHVMFFDSISLMAAAACIFILRRRATAGDNGKQVFKMRGYPFLPACYILVYLAVNVSVFYANPIAAVSGFILFVSGFPLYYLIKFALDKKRELYKEPA
jgi:basic amino acid/polyamine antiporter, APA family